MDDDDKIKFSPKVSYDLKTKEKFVGIQVTMSWEKAAELFGKLKGLFKRK